MRYFIVLTAAGAILVGSLASCFPNVPSDNTIHSPVAEAEQDHSSFGMSYTGKPGTEVLPGVIITYDGEVQPGFGF
jgi:hypothetical protein